MTIVGDGNQKRDFTYIDDVVEANIKAIELSESKSFGIYNIGTGKNYTINQVSEMIGGKVKYITERPAEVRETLADISLTIKDLNWRPTIHLKDIINSY
jgi:UDP-glucose 4-epimerase